MSPNRKADLQRKLAMAPLPKPPAGLAERIKSDIPKHLLVDARQERKRLSQSVVFNVRVAASVLLLVMSLYLALHVLSHEEFKERVRPPERATATAPVAKAAPQPVAQPPAVVAPAPPPLAPKTAVAPPQAVEKKEVIVAEAKTEPLAKRQEERPAGVAGGAIASAPAAEPPPVIAEAPPPAPAAPMAVHERTDISRAAKPALVPEAQGAALDLAPSTLFNIVLPGNEVKGPALIQHFAAPAKPPRTIRLDAEATTLDETPILRVSVDAPEVQRPSRGSRPPVAADASLDIDFNDQAIASHRTLAGTTSASEAAIPSGASVTALFAIEMKPDISRRATIATVRLRYHSVTDGKEHVVTRQIRRSDLLTWEKASRRMKSASLAGALVHSLESAASVAEKARAAHLDELAEIAEKR